MSTGAGVAEALVAEKEAFSFRSFVDRTIGDGGAIAPLVPVMAEGLRTAGATDVRTGPRTTDHRR